MKWCTAESLKRKKSSCCAAEGQPLISLQRVGQIQATGWIVAKWRTLAVTPVGSAVGTTTISASAFPLQCGVSLRMGTVQPTVCLPHGTNESGTFVAIQRAERCKND